MGNGNRIALAVAFGVALGCHNYAASIIVAELNLGFCQGFVGNSLHNGEVVTSGGRVLGVTAVSDTLQNAINASYAMVDQIKFENSYCRRDIGARALKAPEVK